MTPDEVNQMQEGAAWSRAVINKAFETLKSIAFKYDQMIMMKKYEEAHPLMEKLAAAGIALEAFDRSKDMLCDHESIYSALILTINGLDPDGQSVPLEN